MRKIIDDLSLGQFEYSDILEIIKNKDGEIDRYLFEKADSVRQKIYSKDVYIRGLIEFTNYCKNDCFYCGIRASNKNAERYRLTDEDILSCCKNGYELGFRTFVLQGGEDPYYTDDKICEIVHQIKTTFPDCAVTLSIGEKSKETYKRFYDAGADRYLLRHETASEEHYNQLHPDKMSFKNRISCLYNLKEIGFQVGAGFMVGSPFQTAENLANDLMFLKEFNPHMVGIGPFIPHSETPFSNFERGTLRDTLVMVALTRLILPNALIPATTALGTIDPCGRELGLKAGANVVMPNLSPVKVRKLYDLYENKICTGEEAAECKFCLENRVRSAGYEIVVSKGDYKKI
ncbi:MAG TPA: [FeFe] hydrogenase H-cluster radical SAM maturase HydE [Oscillospiraceae bacterium]|nr:[FeFe] hydrogenase H-cluster radical SAM maturase HydE [Oscillospiraceae bacterium]